VVDVPPASPAAKAGLLPGDAIVRIDAKPIAGLSSQQIHELLRGEVGSAVELVVQRDGTQHTLRIARAPYQSK
jgi:carboxyl-terminal processing protease